MFGQVSVMLNFFLSWRRSGDAADPSLGRVRLSLLRMEDRVLLDAGGLAPHLNLLPAGLPAATVAIEQAPADAQSVASFAPAATFAELTDEPTIDEASLLKISGNRLTFADIHSGRDTQLMVTVAGNQFQIRDDAGHAIRSDIPGAIGSGTSAVMIPLSSLAGVTDMSLNVGDGDNTVVFDLSQSGNEFLTQFATVHIDVASYAKDKANINVVFMGDGSTDLRYLREQGGDGSARVETTHGAQSSSFHMAQRHDVDVTGMKRAEFVSSGGNARQLAITAGKDAGSQSQDALVVALTGDEQDRRGSVRFFGNETLHVRSPQYNFGVDIYLLSADNNHRNHNLVLESGEAPDAATGYVWVKGPVVLAGDLLVATTVVQVEATVQVVGLIELVAESDIRFVDHGSLRGSAVAFVSESGRIVSESAEPVLIAGQAISITAARDIGTRDLPIRTRADTLTLDVTESGGIHLVENDQVVVLSATTTDGPIQIATGGNLTVQGDVSSESDIGLTSGGNLSLVRGSVLTTVTGAITLRPNALGNGNGRLTIDGTIVNASGATTLWVSGELNRVDGVISGGGSVIKQGPGVLTLGTDGRWTHTGVTRLEQGSLVVNGTITSSSQLSLDDATVLQGGGNIVAPVFSDSATARILVTGNLRLGDGSAVAFDFAGSLIVQVGQTLTIRDADLANLGRLTQLHDRSVIVAAGGLEVGEGERLTGTGELRATLVVRQRGTLEPGLPVGTLYVGDLLLEPGSLLVLDITGSSTTTYDQLIVRGFAEVDGAVLQLNVGQFTAAPGTVYRLIEVVEPSRIDGLFVDAQGRLLSEGILVQFGSAQATQSYIGGPQSNDLELTTVGILYFIPQLDSGRDEFLAFQIPSSSTIRSRAEPEAVRAERSVDEVTSNAETFDQVERVDDDQLESDLRLFFRVYDDALMTELDQEFVLPPSLLEDLPALFDRHHFPNGHYKIYLQEMGSDQVRQVLDVQVYDGKVVPENFRESDRPFSSPAQPDKQAEVEPVSANDQGEASSSTELQAEAEKENAPTPQDANSTRP